MSSRSDALDRLQAEIPRLWRGRGAGPAGTSVLPSGHPPLDELLPGGGWPVGALTELDVDLANAISKIAAELGLT